MMIGPNGKGQIAGSDLVTWILDVSAGTDCYQKLHMRTYHSLYLTWLMSILNNNHPY